MSIPPTSRPHRPLESVIVNWVATSTGNVRAICQHCDRRSRPVAAEPDGRPGFWDLRGWTETPYPINHRHADGSRGSKFCCPSCYRRRVERQRQGVGPLLSPTAERLAATRAAQSVGAHMSRIAAAVAR